MSLIQSQPWEVRLLLAAQEAFNSQSHLGLIKADHKLLSAAYAHCALLTRRHSRTFFMASGLLPANKRVAVRALYAFCRVTDNIVDNPARTLPQRLETLRQWQTLVSSYFPFAHQSVCLAWADTRAKFNIPHGYASQLIDGVARDLYQTRYQSFDDLAEYAYGVASTVGLMAMHIIGFQGQDALPYAIRLGIALQITNILRDIGEDWRNGRLYLPLDELAAFGLTEEDIAHGSVTPRWREFMAFQIERNRRLYDESAHGIAMLDHSGRFAIAAAATLYKAILSDIEAHDYNVFQRRAFISTTGKLRRLPLIWWTSQRGAI
jgi:15-cis-phytoene synthase